MKRQSLSQTLAELERSNPSVRAAAKNYDRTVWRILRRQRGRPPWAIGDMPEPRLYVESELFVAGALSTMPPFDQYHPAWALPFARQALEALGKWEPTDAVESGSTP